MKRRIIIPPPAVMQEQVRTLIASIARGTVALQIIDALIAAHCRPLIVGGTVRDLLLHRPIHDIDIEVHHCTLAQLQAHIAQFGTLLTVGKAYGVLRLAGCDIDWSIPRQDAAGRHPVVQLGPTLPEQQAFARRDLTINAIGIDAQSGVLIDPFNGIEDLRNGILRAPDSSLFVQDPLRFYRVLRFSGILSMVPDQELTALCATMSLAGIAQERCYNELWLWLAHSPQITASLRWLMTIGRLSMVVPGAEPVSATVMDTVSTAVDSQYLSSLEPQWRFIGRAAILVGMLRGDIPAFVQTITGTIADRQLIKRCIEQLRANAHKNFTPYDCKKLAFALQPIPLAVFVPLYAAYHALPTALTASYIATADAAGVLTMAEEPIITGDDLLPYRQPGPAIGRLLAAAYALQLTGITDKQQLLAAVIKKQS